MITVLVLVFIIITVITVIQAVKINSLSNRLRRLKWDVREMESTQRHYNYSLSLFRDKHNRLAQLSEQLQSQVALFFKDAGWKFIPSKEVTTIQGDESQVKVTPAKFVKSKRSR